MAAPPKRTKMAGAPPELLSEPPSALSEPLIYLSARQALECGKRAGLSRFADHLPGWVPATVIAEALGFSDEGIRRAIQYTGGPYLWATEFENVHTLWEYAEPDIVIGGKRFAGSEAYYHSQKPVPFDDAKWQPMRVEVMRTAVRAKFAAAADARALLMATHPHPLLSIKGDCFWGFDARHGGENKLAELLMELRSELVAGGGPLPSEAVEPSTPPLFTLSGSGSTRAMAVVWSSILPHLPPRVQQQLATGSETEKLEIEARVLKVVEDGSGMVEEEEERIEEGVLRVIGGPCYALASLHGMRERGELDAVIVGVKARLAAAVASDGGATAAAAASFVASAAGGGAGGGGGASSSAGGDGKGKVEDEDEDEEASQAHSVLERGVGALLRGRALAAKAAPLAARIEYRGQEHTVHAPPSLTGLQLKSKVIAELGLDGGFQDYYLRLQSTAFGSRSPVSAHPGFVEGCLIMLEDVGERPKAVGMT